MQSPFLRLALGSVVLTVGLLLSVVTRGQDAPTDAAVPQSDAPPPVPQGVDVQARGPMHEAFAAPSTEPVPAKPVAKEPPKPLDELPPEQKPEGNAVWIGGYWAWDDERNDYLWVSGTWRVPPPSKNWVAGYWKEDGGQWTWVAGFWAAAQQQQAATTEQVDATQQVKYLPAPPQPPATASPGEAPSPESFYVPGQWVYHDAGYVTLASGTVWREPGYSWQDGYWARVQPGYVWVQGHYRWTPAGFIYVSGYWDLVIARRGFLYAPVYVNTVVVGPTFVYTPVYAVNQGAIVEVMFVRPHYCHYYYGDYYGPAYHGYGYESCIVYSRGHYDAIFVYERYEHRREPEWERVQINLVIARNEGRAPRPPRVIDQHYVTTSAQVAAVNHIRTEHIEAHARIEARQHAQAIQRVAAQRNVAERPVAPGRPIQAHTAALNVPHTQAQAARMSPASTAHATATTTAHTQAAAPGQSRGSPAQPPPGRGAMPANNPAGRSNQAQKTQPRPVPPKKDDKKKQPPGYNGRN
jgi:hypothetical protein